MVGGWASVGVPRYLPSGVGGCAVQIPAHLRTSGVADADFVFLITMRLTPPTDPSFPRGTYTNHL